MPTIPRLRAVAPLALAIDVGSSSARALLFDRHGDALAETEEQIGYDLRTTPDGGAEVDAAMLFDLVGRCVDGALRRAGPSAKEIAAVGVSCFWHSLLGLDGDGSPVTPVLMWADTRSAADTDTLRETLDESAVHDRTGCVLHSSYWPAKLHWLRRTEPERFAAVRRWCAFSDWLARRFFGADQTSVSMASGTGMLDVRRVVWDGPMVEALALDPSTLPPIAGGEPLRGLGDEWATRWPALKDVPWLPGIGDGACANVGAGAVGSDRIALTVGTTGAMRIVVPCPVGGALSLPRDLWAYRLDHERAVIGAAISNGGLLMSWLSDLVGVDFDDQEMADAALLAPDAHGLTLLPFLAGERSPIWNDRAHGVVAGLTLHTTKADLLRAGMESVAYRFARLYRAMTTGRRGRARDRRQRRRDPPLARRGCRSSPTRWAARWSRCRQPRRRAPAAPRSWRSPPPA